MIAWYDAQMPMPPTTTRAAVVTERLWPLVLPILLVASLFVSLSWLGLFRAAPDWLRLGLAVLFALAVALLAWLATQLGQWQFDRLEERDEEASGGASVAHAGTWRETGRSSARPWTWPTNHCRCAPRWRRRWPPGSTAVATPTRRCWGSPTTWGSSPPNSKTGTRRAARRSASSTGIRRTTSTSGSARRRRGT